MCETCHPSLCQSCLGKTSHGGDKRLSFKAFWLHRNWHFVLKAVASLKVWTVLSQWDLGFYGSWHGLNCRQVWLQLPSPTCHGSVSLWIIHDFGSPLEPQHHVCHANTHPSFTILMNLSGWQRKKSRGADKHDWSGRLPPDKGVCLPTDCLFVVRVSASNHARFIPVASEFYSTAASFASINCLVN